ncbi:MAG: hypothetical protein K940chlam5_00347 [Candidatus Anoxychlamydiales bacterium]|nr:hypothetical protein [Candidatus Anoxychlamydiales bacterium]
MSSVSSSTSPVSSSTNLPMPTYIQLLSKVPFKAVPISSTLILATNYLMGWEITALKFAAIGFASGFFLPAIGIAKGIINWPESDDKTIITLREKRTFLRDPIIAGIVGSIVFGLISKVL